MKQIALEEVKGNSYEGLLGKSLYYKLNSTEYRYRYGVGCSWCPGCGVLHGDHGLWSLS